MDKDSLSSFLDSSKMYIYLFVFSYAGKNYLSETNQNIMTYSIENLNLSANDFYLYHEPKQFIRNDHCLFCQRFIDSLFVRFLFYSEKEALNK